MERIATNKRITNLENVVEKLSGEIDNLKEGLQNIEFLIADSTSCYEGFSYVMRTVGRREELGNGVCLEKEIETINIDEEIAEKMVGKEKLEEAKKKAVEEQRRSNKMGYMTACSHIITVNDKTEIQVFPYNLI